MWSSSTPKLNLPSQDSPKLPLELLVSIACFLAGDNLYGTLLALCMTSKCIREETRPVLYETVEMNDPEVLYSEEEEPHDYRYTKYVRTPATSHSTLNPNA